MTKTRFSILHKILSLIILQTFIANNVLYADISFLSREVDKSFQHEIQALRNDPSSLLVSASAAQISSSHKGQGEKLIIHIQDAHTNLGAQKNLAKILDEVIAQYGVDLVFVEGGTGNDSLSFLRSYAPLNVRKRVAMRFLERGEIAGEEYLDIISDKNFQLWGIEDPVLYEKSLISYARVVGVRKEAKRYLDEIGRAISRIKPRVYTREFYNFERKAFEFRDSRQTFVKYYERLVEKAGKYDVNMDHYPTVSQMGELRRLEKKIDFGKANREQSRIATKLSRGAPHFARLIQDAEALKIGQIPTRAFYEKFQSIIEKGKIVVEDYPHFSAYLEYLDHFTRMRIADLLKEIEALEEAVYTALAHDPDAKRLREITRYVMLMKNYYSLKLKPSEFKLYQEKATDFKTISWLAFINEKLIYFGWYDEVMAYNPILDEQQGKVDSFYKTVEARDFAFMDRAFSKMDETKRQVAVLICGGYHTPHLKSLIEDKGASYVVVTPHVSEETDMANYERVLLGALDPTKRWLATNRDGTIRPESARQNYVVSNLAVKLLEGRANVNGLFPRANDVRELERYLREEVLRGTPTEVFRGSSIATTKLRFNLFSNCAN